MGGEGRKADVAEAGPTHGERSSAALVEGTMYSLVGRQGWLQAQKRLTQICARESEAHSSLAAADPDGRLTPSRAGRCGCLTSCCAAAVWSWLQSSNLQW